jgi:hypothetical protein
LTFRDPLPPPQNRFPFSDEAEKTIATTSHQPDVVSHNLSTYSIADHGKSRFIIELVLSNDDSAGLCRRMFKIGWSNEWL